MNELVCNEAFVMPKRILSGTVVSNKPDKTIIVRVTRQVKHPLYKKIIRRSKKFFAHDEENKFNVGDFVKIQECKPYSKNKSWIVMESNKDSKNVEKASK